MVIQRGSMTWGTTSQQQQQPSTQLAINDLDNDSSSLRTASVVVTDSNRSSAKYSMSSAHDVDTQPATAEWKNTFNMRQVTLSNLASSQLGLRNSYRPNLTLNRIRGRCITSTAKSLEVLRQNLQSSINKELDVIIKKYLENFFQPAVDNIRANLGTNSVSEDHVRDVCRAILDEAKQMYCTAAGGSGSRTSSPYNELSDSETNSVGEYRFGRPSSHSPLFRKRKESDTDSEASQTVRRKRSRPRPPSHLQVGQSPLKLLRGEPIRRDGPKWDPNRINKETLFVMGARANKVLGFGQTRGRLYIKHPTLLKYSGDQEDKEWLSGHNLMPPTGGKAYLMVLEDIQELAVTDEYRNNPNLLLHELKGFEAPEFMLRKIRSFVTQTKTGVVKVESPDYCDGLDQNLLMVNTGLGAECSSAADMTPPPTVLVDSGPPTPSEALELLECSSVAALAAHSSLDSAYLRLNSAHHLGSMHGLGSHHGLVTTYSQADTMSASHATLSALLAGHITSDNSQEGVE